MFQSDWKTIGGQNVAEFGTNWGGEDWETVDRYHHNYELICRDFFRLCQIYL